MRAMGLDQQEIDIACDDPDIDLESEREQVAAMDDILRMNEAKSQ